VDLELSDKHVVITGGSRGIGLATALRFAAEGARVSLVARSHEMLEAAAAQCRQHGSEASALAVDLGSADATKRIFEAFPDADILVNNAGDIPGGTLDVVSAEVWRRSWDAKVFGYVDLTRAYLASMKARRSGVIVNVLGIAGDLCDATYIAGSTGNAALSAFTKAMGAWTVQFGVRVVGVNPGPVATDRLVKIQQRKAQERTGDASRWREAVSGFPLGRAATPEELAKAIAFMASPASAYTSGAILTIDGGISAGRAIV
jgi:NAD(P)-dependent dehydrogenase (short-subunit alcohol dehydrogenase family)